MQTHRQALKTPFSVTLAREAAGSTNIIPPIFGKKKKKDKSSRKLKALVFASIIVLKTKMTGVPERDKNMWKPSLDKGIKRQPGFK